MNFATRPWFRLSLKGLFVVVALFGIGRAGFRFSWIGFGSAANS